MNRSERTVRRWETTEELPVHRLQHEKRGSVYAYTRELDAWRAGRRVPDEPEDEVPRRRIAPVWLAAGALAVATGFYMPSVDPTWNAIRATPRFRAMLARMNLPTSR